DEPARLRTGLQGSIPADPGIRGTLHPPRHLPPPSPYRRGYASVGRLAGGGASTLSVHGLCGNGTLETALTLPPVLPTTGVPRRREARIGAPPLLRRLRRTFPLRALPIGPPWGGIARRGAATC